MGGGCELAEVDVEVVISLDLLAIIAFWAHSRSIFFCISAIEQLNMNHKFQNNKYDYLIFSVKSNRTN